MPSKTVRLDEDVYELIKKRKREDESFSDAIERLVSPPSLLELAGMVSDEESERMREAIERAGDSDREAAREIAARFEDNTE
jgi:predicted CopG family antitoxin